MQNNQLGAHEVIELHEVLNDAINGINQFHLYEPHVQDETLREILNHQIEFLIKEYNQLVNVMNTNSQNQGAVSYRTFTGYVPRYGLDEPQSSYPKPTANQLTDQDIATGMLSCHKSSAMMKMTAALEFANLQLRNMMTQGAKNCSDLAYETFQYMNERGYYQVPILSNQADILGQYIQAPNQHNLQYGFQ
ncbi:spore coat protein [Cytobacillus sp. FJAT-54145]|uniref:Spore coat protein n=1 Tax=Cytobacillus spartinae TaxID=3299023 RepID=A0ABW6K5W2_9BACI